MTTKTHSKFKSSSAVSFGTDIDSLPTDTLSSVSTPTSEISSYWDGVSEGNPHIRGDAETSEISKSSYEVQFANLAPKTLRELKLKELISKQKSKAKPLILDRIHDVKRVKDNVVYKITPAVNAVKHESRKVTGWIGNRTAQAGLSIALKSVQLITGKKNARTDVSEDEETDGEEGDCPLDLSEIEHAPVHVPKLAVETEIDPGHKKDKLYFLNLKEAKYNAIKEQAKSPFTRDLADKILKGELKQPVHSITTASLGPRIRVGFKCDVAKKSLTIRLTEGSNLPGMDGDGLSDPFCTAQLKPDAAIPPLRTKTIGKTLHPQWKEVFELSPVPPIAKLATQTLHVKVFDYDQLGYDDLLGTVDIKLAQYDLQNGTDLWFDLQIPKSKDELRYRGSVYTGLRYEESQEKITLFIERCQQLESTGILIIKSSLHINGGLIHMKNCKKEKIATVNPDLKRRVTFTGIKKSLLEEYTITIYFGLKKLFWTKYIGQVNLSSKSKNLEEQEIWMQMIKLPGEVEFKLIPIQRFLGLVRKPWKPTEEPEVQKLGFLDISIKSSDKKDGVNFTITINKADELLIPENSIILVKAFLIKNSVEISNESCEGVAVGERITAIEERLSFSVPYADVMNVNIAVIVFHKTFFKLDPIGQVYFSSDHSKSTNDEAEVWQNAVKTTGNAFGKRLEIRRILPEITLYNLTKAPEKTIGLQDPEMNFAKNKLGTIVLSVNYNSHSELLQIFVERFNDLSVDGDLCAEAFFWDLKSKPRFRRRTDKITADDPNPEFKEIIKFKNMHATFFETQYLFVRLVKCQFFGKDLIVGQTALKLNNPKP